MFPCLGMGHPEDEQDEDPKDVKKSMRAGNARKARTGMQEAAVTPLPAGDDEEDAQEDFANGKDNGKLGKQTMNGEQKMPIKKIMTMKIKMMKIKVTKIKMMSLSSLKIKQKKLGMPV